MGANITTTVGYDDGTGTWQPVANAKLYLKPSRTDIFVLRSGVWVPWEGFASNDTGYKDAIQVVTNGSGVATFVNVPFTDTEVQRPLDASGAQLAPPVLWNVYDPNSPTGLKVYYGPFPSGTFGAGPYKLKDLCTTAYPNTWNISGSGWQAYPVGSDQMSSITLAPGADEAVVNFNPAFAAPPRLFFGTCADSTGAVITFGVKENGSGGLLLTGNSATLKASAKPQSAVTLFVLARG